MTTATQCRMCGKKIKVIGRFWKLYCSNECRNQYNTLAYQVGKDRLDKLPIPIVDHVETKGGRYVRETKVK